MKKMYLILLLPTMVSNITFNNIDISNIDEHISSNYPTGFFDPCPNFRMESEEELKQLLFKNGFTNYDEITELSKQLADEKISPYGIVDAVHIANYNFNKYMKTGDKQKDAATEEL